MNRPSTLGEQLRRLRLAADLTLEALAERSGVSVRTIGDVERGVSVAPHRRTVDALARGLRLGTADRESLLREVRARRAVPAQGSRASAVAPHRVGDFSGRERELAEVAAFLDASRTGRTPPVVISGLAGIGKTTTALEAIHRLDSPRPILFLDLDGLSPAPLTPLQVVSGLLRQVPGVGDAAPRTLDDAVRRWSAVTAGTPVTVLLDNADAEAQVRPVLTLDPRSAVVVTSRRALTGLEGVRRVTLGPLRPDESVELLGRIIPADQRDAGDLRELAELSSHVPLAMRIAGNRIAAAPAVRAGDFSTRIRSAENRLRMLVAGDLAVEAAFTLSYDDLDPAVAALFRAISVIDTGTFDARLATATVGPAVSVVDVETGLDELTDLGLVEARGGNRYRLHDLVRVFAGSRLADADSAAESEARRARLRHWLLGSLERAGAWFEPDRSPTDAGPAGVAFSDAEAADAWIRLEEQHWWPAMQAAARAGEHELVVEVADALHWFSELWADWGHWVELFGLAVDAARALQDDRLEAMHLGYLVWATVVESRDRVEGLRLARLAVAAAARSGDHQQLGWTHYYLGWMLQQNGLDGGPAASRAALLHFGLAGDSVGTTSAAAALGNHAQANGDHQLALDEHRAAYDRVQAEAPFTTHAMTYVVGTLHYFMAMALVGLDRPAEAIEEVDRALAIAEDVGAVNLVRLSLRVRATAHLATGDGPRARADVERALDGLDLMSSTEMNTALRDSLLPLLEEANRLT
ncbi:AAA ATPase-like protein [Isoptericola jiangsuensis]|uniref:AAA ATPase-like protein n=1 Tax=Isoptericola jiangsuensis TaxID=548579 RepID=A0A2A9F1T2_9MICO|nr:helix-turn-helix domain-containing protein [Isoptericola jiangsuensis]PFG44776.1 AAA ATPase-like protein [Isoptericola jiangsuensis]